MKVRALSHHRRNELPPGAEPFGPETLKLGTYTPQQVDARLQMHGVTWYRVKGGFGGQGDREDWIADLPFSVSASDYNWNGAEFGADYGSFENALTENLRHATVHARYKVEELRAQVEKLDAALASLPEVDR